MSDQPRCDKCGGHGLYQCRGVIVDGENARGCGKLICTDHIAGTAVIHYHPGGWKRVPFCGPCWERRQREIADRRAKLAAKESPAPTEAP